MSIPTQKQIEEKMFDYLRANTDEHKMSEIIELLSKKFKMTDEDKRKMVSSNRMPVFANRVWFARLALINKGLIESSKRSHVRITKEGLNVPQTPSLFSQNNGSADGYTPDQFEKFIEKWDKNLKEDILKAILGGKDDFFERIVLDLLCKITDGEGEVTGKSGDGGIDGYVNLDKLGIDKILFQAKRYKKGNKVDDPSIREFMGSLKKSNATKGVFVTSSDFSEPAQKSAKDQGITLINGDFLVSLMVEHDIGVILRSKYEIKEVDQRYFGNE